LEVQIGYRHKRKDGVPAGVAIVEYRKSVGVLSDDFEIAHLGRSLNSSFQQTKPTFGLKVKRGGLWK